MGNYRLRIENWGLAHVHPSAKKCFLIKRDNLVCVCVCVCLCVPRRRQGEDFSA